MPQKKVAVFGAGGKIHKHLGTLVLPQEDEGVANHAGILLVYYIVQLIKSQGCCLQNCIKFQTFQNTRNVHIHPINEPRLATAPNVVPARNKTSIIGIRIMYTPSLCQDASTERRTCLPYASLPDILLYNRSKYQALYYS